MRIKLIILAFVSVIFVGLPINALAKTNSTYIAKTVVKQSAVPSSTPTPVVSSFDLFWPMVAGKTVQSKLYFLKTLKEEIRGFFIFGSAQKVDYRIFLAIKRTLEAEVLIKGNLSTQANATLDAAISNLEKANSALINAKNSSDIDQSTKDEINTRVSNLKKLVTSMKANYPDYKDKLQSILDKLNSITI